jgi:Flp pilus assembly protein TadB
LTLLAGAVAWRLAAARRGRTETAAASGAGTDHEGRSLTAHLRRLLARAGWPISPWAYLVLVGAVSCVVGAIAGSIFFTVRKSAALIGFLMSAYVLHSMLVEFAIRRSTKFEERLIAAVDLVIGALRAGENPLQALLSAGDASANPVKTEFREIGRRLGIGMPIARSLAGMRVRYDSEGVRLFSCTLVAKWAAGGDLTPVLTAVNRIMRERLHFRAHLKGQLAGAQASSLLVAVSPYMLLFIYAWRKPEWLKTLVTHPLGSALLFTTICVQLIGFLWIQRIMRTEM